MCTKNIVYNMITIFTIFGQNTFEFYDKHIFLTVLRIFWPEFRLKPRYFELHLMEKGKVFSKHCPPSDTRSY